MASTLPIVPPFPGGNKSNALSSWSPKQQQQQLRRPSSFLQPEYGSVMFKSQEQPLYGYAIVQRPYLVPIGSSSVSYMSCYTTINAEPHYYVNGDFLAEKLRLEEEVHRAFARSL